MEPQNSGINGMSGTSANQAPVTTPAPTPSPAQTSAQTQAPTTKPAATPTATAQNNEPPKITGLTSTISKDATGKVLPPSNVVNKQTAPVAKPEKKKVELPPPTEEEISNYIRSKRHKKAIISIIVLILVGTAAIAGIIFFLKYQKEQDNKYSDGYSANYPYIIRNKDNTYYIANNSGKKISGDYNNIEDYFEGYAVACNSESCDILDIDGNKSYSGSKIKQIIGSGKFLEQKNDFEFYNAIDSTGNKINEERITAYKTVNNHTYLVSKNAEGKGYSLLNSEAKVVASDNTENIIMSQDIDINYSKFENKYYCGISTQTRGAEYLTRYDIYDCDNGHRILSLDKINNNFYDKIPSDNIFKLDDTSYVIYDDELTLKTDLNVAQANNGIVYGLNDYEGFEPFNPRTKNTVDENSNGLIDEGKYDIVPSYRINDYFEYTNYSQTGYEFFKNSNDIAVYKDGKKQSVKNVRKIFSEELFNYLHFKQKDYVLVQENGKLKIYDLKNIKTLDLGGDIESIEEDSCLVILSTDSQEKKKIYNLITGSSFEITLNEGEYINLEKRYLTVNSISEQKVKYYSQTGKMVAEISYNEEEDGGE